MPSKRKKILRKKVLLFVVAISCVAIAVVASLFYIPFGTGVSVFVSTTPTGLSINGCSLKTVYVLSSSSFEISGSSGDRLIVMKVFNGQTEIFSVQKGNIMEGIGNFFIESPALPSDLGVNTELRVEVQLKDASGSIIAQDQTTIIFN
jgi:hypothetical protein